MTREELDEAWQTRNYARAPESRVAHRTRRLMASVTWCGLKVVVPVWSVFTATRYEGRICRRCKAISELRIEGQELNEELMDIERYCLEEHLGGGVYVSFLEDDIMILRTRKNGSIETADQIAFDEDTKKALLDLLQR